MGFFCLVGFPTTLNTPPHPLPYTHTDPRALPPAVIPPRTQQASVSLTMGSLWNTPHVLHLSGEGPSG